MLSDMNVYVPKKGATKSAQISNADRKMWAHFFLFSRARSIHFVFMISRTHQGGLHVEK